MDSHPHVRNQTLVLSYLGIRRAIGISGLILPVLLGPVGWLLFGIKIQDNISAYYHTEMRDVFVGTLCAIGIFLFCYRGYDRVENWTANLGCAAALGVALFPLDIDRDPLHPQSLTGLVHTFSGGVFFLTLAFYSFFHFPSRRKHEDAPHEPERNFVYRTSGVVILGTTLAMGGYLFLLPADWKRFANEYNLLFWMEWVAIWSFAAAWLTKGRTLLADVAVDLMAIPAHLLHRELSRRNAT